jgi:hypothetical protein
LTFVLKAKEYLANPEAFAVAAPVASEAAPAEAAKAEEKEEEKEEESDEDMVRMNSVLTLRKILILLQGFGLFD